MRFLALLAACAVVAALEAVDPCKRQPFRGRCPSKNGESPKRSQFVLRYYMRNGECVSYPYGHCNSDDTEPQLYRYKEECEDACINPPPANLGSPKIDIDQTYITIGPVGNDVRPDEAAVTQTTAETTQVSLKTTTVEEETTTAPATSTTSVSTSEAPTTSTEPLPTSTTTEPSTTSTEPSTTSLEVTTTTKRTPGVTTDSPSSTTEEPKVLDSSAKVAKEQVKTSAEVSKNKEAPAAPKVVTTTTFKPSTTTTEPSTTQSTTTRRSTYTTTTERTTTVQADNTSRSPSTQSSVTTAPKTECERRRASAASSTIRGGFVPACTANGAFEKVQCEPDGRQCFCVDARGIEIANSRTRNGQKPDCDGIQSSSVPKTKECVGGAARGPCSAALTRWYYDEQEAKCKVTDP
ncbi:thyroglobulin type-1 repeat-containing domain protein [Teladorsagia circumcincta]|uniref:Thyroglobulin type-1 repeat-containing domain protein n=1 Tax=Teladorsagia circumcincta TaxID=45464 RepID=A0A2G9UPU7_TELCI|nr:thyroglobulin type-1 repeat-containing domain protein [Teladorsagia circumcincta]